MQEVCVPGHVLLVTTDVALHSGVSSERRQVIVQFVCAASVFFLLCRIQVPLLGYMQATVFVA